MVSVHVIYVLAVASCVISYPAQEDVGQQQQSEAGRENSFWFCVCPVVPGEKDKYRPSKKEEPLQL